MNDEWCPSTGEHVIPTGLDEVTAARTRGTARDIDATARSADNMDLILGVSETDVRLVDALYHELALDASNARTPASRAERDANAESAASFARLKAMTPDELSAERARRMRARQQRRG